MIELICGTCHKLWHQPCEDCARDSADRHAINTGHTNIRIRDEASR